MTRLKTEDISGIVHRLDEYDKELETRTGHNLRSLACIAAHIPGKDLLRVIDQIHIAVVPIRTGEGIITGFSEAVQGIVAHLGFPAFITSQTDAAGIAEAVNRSADVIMMADDFRFIALNINIAPEFTAFFATENTGRKVPGIADNNESTARAFVTGLDLMAGGLNNKPVFVIGCGILGKEAVLELFRRGAEPAIFDIDHSRMDTLIAEVDEVLHCRPAALESLEQGLGRFPLIFDASNAAGIIDESIIKPNTYIAAPGMPLGLTPGAYEQVFPRLIHDPLQLGTAVMAVKSPFTFDGQGALFVKSRPLDPHKNFC